MKRRLYTIYDLVAEEGIQIFEAINDRTAQRSFEKFQSDATEQHKLFEVTDFILVHLGEIDKTTNVITAESPAQVRISLRLAPTEDNIESL